MLKDTIRKHNGRLFRRRRYKLPGLKMPRQEGTEHWRKPEASWSFENQKQWCKPRNNVTWSIWTGGEWRYCFSNVPAKHLRKWLDYYSKIY